MKPVNFLSHEIWLPPIEWQNKIESTAEALANSKPDRDFVDKELDALLPAILDRAFKGLL